jgi:hypothetical protein
MGRCGEGHSPLENEKTPTRTSDRGLLEKRLPATVDFVEVDGGLELIQEGVHS